MRLEGVLALGLLALTVSCIPTLEEQQAKSANRKRTATPTSATASGGHHKKVAQEVEPAEFPKPAPLPYAAYTEKTGNE